MLYISLFILCYLFLYLINDDQKNSKKLKTLKINLHALIN